MSQALLLVSVSGKLDVALAPMLSLAVTSTVRLDPQVSSGRPLHLRTRSGPGSGVKLYSLQHIVARDPGVGADVRSDKLELLIG